MKSSYKTNFVKKILRFFSLLCACRCIPLAMLLYYLCGVIIFGVLREKQSLEVVMFPLEFTTTGGLEHVASYIRILYGLYVEGAMSLLSYILASLRRNSSATINYMTEKYRLFQVE